MQYHRNDDDNSRSGNSVEEAEIFDEFSDSLTELRVGKKLYQSGDDQSCSASGETCKDAQSFDDDWSCYSYLDRE